MKKNYSAFCLLVSIGMLTYTSVHTQVNAHDSLALVALYNSTDGPHWKNNTNWLTTAPLDSWHGVVVHDNKVTELSLSGNRLKGMIPPAFGQLQNVAYLYLYDNQLSGNIPAEMGNLTNVGFLDMHNNQFSGSIPPELGNLSHLATLQLNNNQLTGAIPPENWANCMFIFYN